MTDKAKKKCPYRFYLEQTRLSRDKCRAVTTALNVGGSELCTAASEQLCSSATASPGSDGEQTPRGHLSTALPAAQQPTALLPRPWEHANKVRRPHKTAWGRKELI